MLDDNALRISTAYLVWMALVLVIFGDGRLQAQETAPPKAAAQATDWRKTALLAIKQLDYDRAYRLVRNEVGADHSDLSDLLLLGDVSFFSGRFDQSVAAYDRAIELAPRLGPQLWQRGLALYYAGRYRDGVRQFESHQTVNSQDVENAVWHLACNARLGDLDQAREELIPIERDRRVPMAEVYELFAGRMTPAQVLAAADKTSPGVVANSPAQRLQQYYGHLYIGLFHDMQGDVAEGKRAMQKALEVNPLPPGNFMGEVARMHLHARAQDRTPPEKPERRQSDDGQPPNG